MIITIAVAMESVAYMGIILKPPHQPKGNSMGYLTITNLTTGQSEFLGDDVDFEKFKRREGIPTRGKGQDVIDEIDKAGE
jgi:hypothetical protein